MQIQYHLDFLSLYENLTSQSYDECSRHSLADGLLPNCCIRTAATIYFIYLFRDRASITVYNLDNQAQISEH